MSELNGDTWYGEDVEILYMDARIGGDKEGNDIVLLTPKRIRAKKHMVTELPWGDVLVKAENPKRDGDLVAVRITHDSILNYRVVRRDTE